MRVNPGLSAAEQKATEFFLTSILESSNIVTAINGFKKAGISPINPNATADKEFAPSDVTNNKERAYTIYTEWQMRWRSMIIMQLCYSPIRQTLMSNTSVT